MFSILSYQDDIAKCAQGFGNLVMSFTSLDRLFVLWTRYYYLKPSSHAIESDSRVDALSLDIIDAKIVFNDPFAPPTSMHTSIYNYPRSFTHTRTSTSTHTLPILFIPCFTVVHFLPHYPRFSRLSLSIRYSSHLANQNSHLPLLLLSRCTQSQSSMI